MLKVKIFILLFTEKPMGRWNVEDVCQFLVEIQLDAYIETFQEEKWIFDHKSSQSFMTLEFNM